MTFLAHPTHYTRDEFRALIAGVKIGAWTPAFPTLHNTGTPSLAQWKSYGATPQERNGKNGVDFPWGISFPPSKAKVGNYADAALHESFPSLKWLEGYTDGSATTSPVGAFAPNEYGLYDMGGNVWQWCEDLFEPGSIDHVLRGAAWDDAARTNLLLSRRIHLTPGNRSNHSGFRCVLANDVPTP